MTEVIPVRKKPYRNTYPSAARYLIEEGVCATPRQVEKDLQWATGVDIIYTLHGMTPVAFKQYVDTFKLLVLQECERYKEHKWKFAGFDVKLGRLPKGKDLQEEVTFGASMQRDAEILVYGEEALGYEVPQKYFFNNKIDNILDISNRYLGKVNKQTPFRVVRLYISIREPKWPETLTVVGSNP